MAERIKVCAYCRVSTDKEDQGNSFEAQQRFFSRELSKNPQYQLVKLYPDKGKTGTKLHGRKFFEEMLYDAGLDKRLVTNDDNDNRKSKIKYVYVASSSRVPKIKYIFSKSTSRFARNILAIEILTELKKMNVYVQFLDMDTNTENEKDMDSMLDYFKHDAQESKTKSKSVRWGHEEGARNGVIHTTNKIFGYDYIKDENRLVAKIEEAETVKKIFELYSQGYGIRRLLNYLAEHNMQTRLKKNFSKSTISKMLSNEKYAGINVRMKYKRADLFTDGSPKIQDESKWIITKNSDKIEAIIDEELFVKCKTIREGKVSLITQKGQYHSPLEYAGLIRCKKCGSNYTRNIDKGRIFFNCSTKKAKGASSCSNINVSLVEIEAVIEQYRKTTLRERVIQRKTRGIERLEKVRQFIINSFDKNKDDEVEELNNQLLKLKNQKNRLIDLYLIESIDEDIIDEKSKELQKRIIQIESNIKEASKDNNRKSEELLILDREQVYVESIQVKNEYTKEDVMSSIKFIEIRRKSEVDIYNPNFTLTSSYNQLKRHDKVAGFVSIATKINEDYRNIMMKYKYIDIKKSLL